jgi:hypothetical protein
LLLDLVGTLHEVLAFFEGITTPHLPTDHVLLGSQIHPFLEKINGA